MTHPWTPTSTALPGEDALVEFVLENREAPMCGVYHLGRFESRWTFYAPCKVSLWRELTGEGCTMEAPQAAVIPRQHECLIGAERFAAAA